MKMILNATDEHKYLKKALSTDGGSVVTFVWIPAGSFIMGENPSSKDHVVLDATQSWSVLLPLPKICCDNECPESFIVFKEGFWMAEAPCTRGQWAAVMGEVGTNEKDLPAAGMSWLACKEFCRRASVAAKCVVDLPTEAEWEYACRAGKRGQTYLDGKVQWPPRDPQPPVGMNEQYALEKHWTDQVSRARKDWMIMRLGALQRIAWFDCDVAHPVCLKEPNGFGLHDMLGNVWEWCRDVYYPRLQYNGLPGENGLGDISESSQLKKRSIRGGGFQTKPESVHCSVRGFWTENHGREEIGFRPIIRSI